MKISDPVKLPSAPHCPHCGELLDGAAALGEVTRTPAPGDLTVCDRCATVCKFTKALGLVALSKAEFAALHPDNAREIEGVRLAVITLRSQN